MTWNESKRNGSKSVLCTITTSFWIKRGYDLESTFHKNLLYPSVRPLRIRPSVSALYPNLNECRL